MKEKEATSSASGGARRTPPSRPRAALRTLAVLGTAGAAGVGYYLYRKAPGDAFSSVDALREFVLGYGLWAPAVFLLVQAAQVILAPVPGGATVVAGTLLFGPWWGTALSLAGGVAGSVVLFSLVRRWGRPLAETLVGQEAYNRYSGTLDGKGLWLFVVMLVPFVPDDVVVALAGLSAVRFRRFVVLVTLGRIPSWAATAFVTSGLVGRSTAALTMAGLILAVLAGVVLLYRKRLEAWLLRLGANRGKDGAGRAR